MAVIKLSPKPKDQAQGTITNPDATRHPKSKVGLVGIANQLVPEIKTSLHALTTAALLLPGLMQPTARAADDDSVDFQYSHYQEGRRDGIGPVSQTNAWDVPVEVDVPNNRNPIEVDSLHGSARITLTDRIKFAFNYTQDTWSGATPMGSAPVRSGAHSARPSYFDERGQPVITGASPFASSRIFIDRNGKPLYEIFNESTGETRYIKDRVAHVLSYASPETRKQGDFKLTYAWDEAAVDVGGGISVERDYESRFVNLGSRFDFNQKQTTLGVGLSYTNSSINAVLHPEGDNYFVWTPQHHDQIHYDTRTDFNTITGTRQDWAANLNLTQVINKDAVGEFGFNYTRSTGFLENPYKVSWVFGNFEGTLPEDVEVAPGIFSYSYGRPFQEQRPNERNLFNWNARWTQYIEPLDAALHLGYSFAHDDWGINAHTFDADWVQPVGWGWTITPRIRYYSQSKADFYQPFFISNGVIRNVNHIPGQSPEFIPAVPYNFSSDQRLSGYGTLSGGVSVAKQFAKGIGIEAGFEYYTHQGGLKLGGGGEGRFADFDYWVANAALKVDLSAMGQSLASGDSSHLHHHAQHPALPAGIMFGHTLAKAGDWMFGYRYQRGMQGGNYLRGTQSVAEETVVNSACPGSLHILDGQFAKGCSVLPYEMTMNMHMLDIMYAPTDWLTLMLMPQWMDMDMPHRTPASQIRTGGHSHGGHGTNTHETGGIGDTGLYALVKLFDRPNHHLHATAGFTAPTGDVAIKLKEGNKNLDGPYIHYGMQLGSGTWDFKPSLTYLGKISDWSWGAQVGGTKRLESSNSSGYALGDLFESSLWGGYDLTQWLTATVRAAYTWQGKITGQYPRARRDDYYNDIFCPKVMFTTFNQFDDKGQPIGTGIFDPVAYQTCLKNNANIKQQDRPSPQDLPMNSGGHYVDLGLGLSVSIPHGAFAGNRLSFEWLQPVHTDNNGYQLDRDGALNFTWSYGF